MYTPEAPSALTAPYPKAVVIYLQLGSELPLALDVDLAHGLSMLPAAAPASGSSSLET